MVADYAKAYLDVMLSYPQLRDILAWGMVDRYSWLDGFDPRADKTLKRGTLIELQTEEPRAPEAFWLAWKTGAKGKALQWWVKQLNRQLVPALLPRST